MELLYGREIAFRVVAAKGACGVLKRVTMLGFLMIQGAEVKLKLLSRFPAGSGAPEPAGKRDSGSSGMK